MSVAYFKSLFRLIHVNYHQLHDKCSSGYLACRPRFEPINSLFLVRTSAKMYREEQKENISYDFYYYDRESKRVSQESNRFTRLE